MSPDEALLQAKSCVKAIRPAWNRGMYTYLFSLRDEWIESREDTLARCRRARIDYVLEIAAAYAGSAMVLATLEPQLSRIWRDRLHVLMRRESGHKRRKWKWTSTQKKKAARSRERRKAELAAKREAEKLAARRARIRQVPPLAPDMDKAIRAARERIGRRFPQMDETAAKALATWCAGCL